MGVICSMSSQWVLRVHVRVRENSNCILEARCAEIRCNPERALPETEFGQCVLIVAAKSGHPVENPNTSAK